MHQKYSSPPGKRSPNRQLLTTLRIPTHISTSKWDDSPRRVSTVVWRTCLIIVGLVVLNAVLAAVILTAVRGFGRSRNMLMQPPAVQKLEQPTQLSLAQWQPYGSTANETRSATMSRLWKGSLGRLLRRPDTFWVNEEKQTSDGLAPGSKGELSRGELGSLTAQETVGAGDEDEVLGRESTGWREETRGSSPKDNKPSESTSQTEVLVKGANAAGLEEWQHDLAGDSIGQHLLPGTHVHAGSQAPQLRGEHANRTESGSSSMQPEGSQPRLDQTILFLGSKAQILPGNGADLAAMLAADMGNTAPAQRPFGAKVPAAAVEALPTSGGLSSSAPLLAATDLVSQAPMPSGPLHGSHTHHIKLETEPVPAEEQSKPVDPAVPAPMTAPQEVSLSELSLPSNSLVTDLQKGQFFPTKGQPAPVSITQEPESTGDIVDDVHALEEHAKAVASTAEVKNGLPVAAAPGPAQIEGSSDACATALSVPKVAIMFLSKAELFHESSWALWFQRAAGLLPVSVLRDEADSEGAACSAERLQLVQQFCSNPQSVAVLQRQHLFSVYLHPLPDFGSFPEESIFHGREIQERIQVSWGAHELVIAARNLLAAALKDLLNQKFILLSESGLPLYPPTTTYLQLMHEDKSRLDSCGMGRTDPWRFGVRMGYKLRRHWRKSSQWFALTRKHADLVMADTELLDIFKAHCKNGWDNDLNRWRDCFSDEHYMPSLIAYLQLGHETDCVGKLVNVDWSTAGAHPKSYNPLEVVAPTFKRLRMGYMDGRPCNPNLAISTSNAAFVRAGSITLQDAAQQACNRSGYNTTALTYDCALFARKFPRNTASAAQHLLSRCSGGLNITNDGVCDQSAEEIPAQRVNSAHPIRRVLYREEGAWENQWSADNHDIGSQLHTPDWLEDRL